MKEVVVTKYEANDGKLFDTKEECLVHESKEVLKIVRYFCLNQSNCDKCPFFNHGCVLSGTPETWDFDEDEDF